MLIDTSTKRGRLIEAALQLAAERPWGEVTLRDIADRAGCNLVEMRQEFASKGDLLAAFTRLVDDAVLAAAPKRLPSQPARDALFEVIMSRLDALAPFRPALRSISRVPTFDLGVAKAILSSQAWMLAAAGIGTDGPEGRLKAVGLASIYGPVARTWLSDDDPGQARTMAVLDRRLRRGERTMQNLDDLKGSVSSTFSRVCCAIKGRRMDADGGKSQTSATGTSSAPSGSEVPPTVPGTA